MKIQATALLGMSVLSLILSANAQIAPPTLGQDTKGKPAIEEPAVQAEEKQTPAAEQKTAKKNNGPLGTATIKESRRENGQVYLIELEHSAGAKQYIEENDSDGNIESEATDIEDTPNLAKWRVGSW